MSDSEPEGEDLARRAETIFTDLREHVDWLSRGKLALDSMPKAFPSAALRLFFLWKAPAGLADNAEAVSRAALSQFCDKQEDGCPSVASRNCALRAIAVACGFRTAEGGRHISGSGGKAVMPLHSVRT